MAVDPPSFKTQGKWQLTAQGWIGFLAVDRGLSIALQPKVPIANLLSIVDYAYGLEGHFFDNELVMVDSLVGFLDQMAYYFIGKVRQQQRVGLYRSYAEMTAALPYVRGQLDFAEIWKFSQGEGVVCRFDELTADVIENQIIAWALSQIASMPVYSARTRSACKHVLADLRYEVSLRLCSPDVCDQVSIHHLNYSYQPLLALARFFLNGSAPSHRSGQDPCSAFLINSARLFERFVAAWMRQNIPARYRLQVQERRTIGRHERLHFAIDLTIYDRVSGATCFVMDTKYKQPSPMPDTADIAQVVAYAEAVGAPQAILIYPTLLSQPIDERIGQIRVRSLVFDLAEELEFAGQNFLELLLEQG